MAEQKDERKKAAAIAAGVAVAGALILLCRRGAGAQDPEKALLYGAVTDVETGSPISGINVACNGYSAKTGGDGSYEILNIEPGTYSVVFSDPHGRYYPVEV